MTADRRAPGPDRPADPRDELVQALLGLRWALPRTDADARVALDQLSSVAVRVQQLAGEQPGDETPWDGQVQALLAQSGFALDWWRPVLDDVDLDWTLNHQAHLSADLARIASAGARILDQFAPAAPPIDAPSSAVTEGPPQSQHHAPRIAAAFGSVPAAAIVGPLANSGRHRRPAYDFESFDSLDARRDQQPADPDTQHQQHPQPQNPSQHVHQQPYIPAAVQFTPPQGDFPQATDEIEPELEHLFRPQQAAAAASTPTAPATSPVPPDAPPLQPPPVSVPGPVPGSPSSIPATSGPQPPPSSQSPSSVPNAPLFGPPSLFAPNTGPGAGPGLPRSPMAQRDSVGQAGGAATGTPPPPAFSRPIVWGGDGMDDEDEFDPVVRERRGPHAGMVIQAVGILGAVAALCWWAATSLHFGSSPAGHPAAAATGTGTHSTASHAPAAGGAASAKAHPTTTPSAHKSQPGVVTPITRPPTSPLPSNAANVKALQVQLLGGSQSVHQIALLLAVNTSGTGRVTVTVDYYGAKDGKKTDERTASWTLSGKTAYSIGTSIPTDAYCGEVFTLKAVSGDATSTQSTNPGC
ncbi:MAG: hypothetical protein ACRDVE_14290 [Actinocrinis sp.]